MDQPSPSIRYQFSVTWVVDDLNFWPNKAGEMLRSPAFTVGILGTTKWRLVLFPRGIGEDGYVGCYLYREIGGGRKTIAVDFRIALAYSLCDLIESVPCCGIHFNEKDYKGFNRLEKVKNVLAGICCNPGFHIRCDLSPSEKVTSIVRWNEQSDMEQLSSDLEGLFKIGRFSDFILKSGGTEFQIHKAILQARAPKLMGSITELETHNLQDPCATIPNISTSVLRTLLHYLYTGKIDVPLSEVDSELFDVAMKLDLPELTNQLRTLPSFCAIHTCMNLENKFVSWSIRNSSDDLNSKSTTLVRFLPCEVIYADDLILRCEVSRHNEGEKRVNVSLGFSGFKNHSPITVSCRVSVWDSKRIPRECFAGEHLFAENEEWRILHLLEKQKNKFKLPDILNLKFSIEMCDGVRSSSITAGGTITEQSYTNVDFTSFREDLQMFYSKSLFCDFTIDCSGVPFPVHKAILQARSPVFNKLLENDMCEKRTKVVHVCDVDPATMDLLLEYMYSGTLGKLRYDEAYDLYEAADKYGMTTLMHNCAAVLMTMISIGNACVTLYVADLHFHEDFIVLVQEFICSNFTEITATEEWKYLLQNRTHLANRITEMNDLGYVDQEDREFTNLQTVEHFV